MVSLLVEHLQVLSCRQWLEDSLLYLLDETQVTKEDIEASQRLGDVSKSWRIG